MTYKEFTCHNYHFSIMDFLVDLLVKFYLNSHDYRFQLKFMLPILFVFIYATHFDVESKHMKYFIWYTIAISCDGSDVPTLAVKSLFAYPIFTESPFPCKKTKLLEAILSNCIIITLAMSVKLFYEVEVEKINYSIISFFLHFFVLGYQYFNETSPFFISCIRSILNFKIGGGSVLHGIYYFDQQTGYAQFFASLRPMKQKEYIRRPLCAFCQTEVRHDGFKTQCGHYVHDHCADKLKECPFCGKTGTAFTKPKDETGETINTIRQKVIEMNQSFIHKVLSKLRLTRFLILRGR